MSVTEKKNALYQSTLCDFRCSSNIRVCLDFYMSPNLHMSLNLLSGVHKEIRLTSEDRDRQYLPNTSSLN